MRAITVLGALLLVVCLAGIIARGWGRLGRAGRYAAVAFPLGIPLAVLGGWSPVGPLGLLLMTSAAVACAGRLIRIQVIASLPLVLFVAGIALGVAYGLIGVEGDAVQAIPYMVSGTGWFWLSYTLWSERAA